MNERGPALLAYARLCVREALGGPRAAAPDAPWTRELGATFVTLRWRDGELQGCIGTLEPEREIVADVAHNAIAAATRDPRGDRLVLADVDDLDVEVSILSPLSPIPSQAEIRVGIDGIVVVYRNRRATFLPVMWKMLPDLATFMYELERKAGLPHDLERSEVKLFRYTVERYVDLAPVKS